MNRTINVTVHLSRPEYEQLSNSARRANLGLCTFMRRELLQHATLSRDAAVVVGEIGRLNELVTRGLEQAGIPMREVAAGVRAIDARVFVAQVQGVTCGE